MVDSHALAQSWTRDPGDLMRRESAGRYGPVRCHQKSARAEPRSGRDLAQRRAPGLPHHGLRQILVRAGKERTRGQEKPETDRAERSKVQRQRGRARLRDQAQPCVALPRRRGQGQGQPALPRTRDGPPEPGSRCARPADPRGWRKRNRGIPPADGRQYHARDPGSAQTSTRRKEAAQATGSAVCSGRQRTKYTYAHTKTACNHTPTDNPYKTTNTYTIYSN